MKKTSTIVIALLVIIAIGLIAIFLLWSRQPSKSNITPQPTQSAPNDTAAAPVKIDTAYFTTTLPAGFVVKTNTESSTNTQQLVQIVAVQPKAQGQQIAITIGQLPADGLAGVSSFTLRSKNPSTYAPVEFGGMPADAKLFSSTNDAVYEITAFSTRSALYAAIASSGITANQTDTNKNLMSVLTDWTWR